MFDTRNDLPANTRTKVIELLNARLADAIDLGAQTKHAHWNVKGPNFIALHELFDKVPRASRSISTRWRSASRRWGARHAVRSPRWRAAPVCGPTRRTSARVSPTWMRCPRR